MNRLGSLTDSFGGSKDRSDIDIDMMPLIDMIFILLIFFLVTASFVKESGVEVNRPEAASSELKEATGMVIGITSGGEIFINREQVELRRVRGLVEIFLAENNEGGVIIDADGDSLTAELIAVLDQCRLAGAENIAVSATKPNN